MEEEVATVLHIEDVARAVTWYDGWASQKTGSISLNQGFPWFVSIIRGSARLNLSEHKGDVLPGTLIHLYIKDVDAVSKEFDVAIGEEGLAGRQCNLDDLDGNRLRVATRRT